MPQRHVEFESRSRVRDPDLRRESLRRRISGTFSAAALDGRDFDDWLEAERELKARRRAS
jgi:hypothetical protein